MSSEIITYSKIREYQREERTKPVLVKLPDNIIELIQIYLKEKKGILEKNKDDGNLFSQDIYSRIEYELKNAIRCIANIFELRQKKVVDKAFLTARNDVKVKDTTNMLYFEKRLFTQLVDLFDEYNKNCILAVLRNEKPSFETVCQPATEEKVLKREETFLNKERSDKMMNEVHQVPDLSDKILIRVTSSVPSFIWEDNSKMGPYNEEDTVFVPKKLGTLLINQKRAEEVKQS